MAVPGEKCSQATNRLSPWGLKAGSQDQNYVTVYTTKVAGLDALLGRCCDEPE